MVNRGFKIPAPATKNLGGKSNMFKKLEPFLPSFILAKEKYTFIEPFVGAGGFYLSLFKKGYSNPTSLVYLNDFNFDLYNIFQEIKHNHINLLSELESLRELRNKEYYLEFRAMYNRKEFTSSCHRAAIFIYLNKTGFNGLVRYNKKGEYNTPYGMDQDRPFFREENIVKLNEVFQTCSFYNLDFDAFLTSYQVKSESENSQTFVYMDPPYIPLSATASFTDYNAGGFWIESHERLRKTMDDLTKRGCSVMLSNSCCPESERIFAGYNFKTVMSPRIIAANKNSRRSVEEYVITNY